MNSMLIPIIIMVAFFSIEFVILYLLVVKNLIKSRANGLDIPLSSLIGMKLRKADIDEILDAAIILRREGINYNISELEAHSLAGGHTKKVAEGMAIAKRAGINLEFLPASAIDLAGRDVVQSVKDCLTPKTFETDKVKSLTKNGDQITVSAKLIVKANINKIIGGEPIDILLEEINNSIVDKIKSADSKDTIMLNIDAIANAVLDEDIDKSTAYEIQELKILLY